MEYKCIPAPKNLVIDQSGSHDQAVRSFADLINREATGGWKFHSMEQVSVTQEQPKSGCLGGLLLLIGLAQKPMTTTTQFNMLIFSKEDAAFANHDEVYKLIGDKAAGDYSQAPSIEPNNDAGGGRTRQMSKPSFLTEKNPMVVVEFARLRTAPASSTETGDTIEKGEFVLKDAENDTGSGIVWCRVVKEDGTTGWCPADCITEGEFQSQSPAAPPVGSVFPRILECPACGKKLKAASQGQFQCPGCQSILAVDANGNCTVSSRGV